MAAACCVSLIALTGCLTPAAGPIEQVVRGPIASRVQQPLALTFLAPRPRRTATQSTDRVGVAVQIAYSSIFELDQRANQSAVFDGEVLRTGIRLRKALGESTDIEIEFAGMYASSGFLDGFLNDFHDVTTLFADGGREDFPDDDYQMQLVKNNRTLYELEENRVGYADTPIILTHSLRPDDGAGPGLAWRLAIELPTGSEERGFGNGGVDYGTGLLLENTSGRWTVSAALDLVENARPKAFDRSGVDVPLIVHAQNGYEYRWSNATSVLAQLVWTSPMTTGFDAEEIDREVLDLGLGCAWDVGAASFVSLTFHEDVIAATGPDFSVLLGFASGF